MAANILISISRKRSRDQNLKNHFPKRNFQWNLTQSKRTWTDLHYWNIFFQIIPFQNGGQNSNAKLCLLPENGAAHLNFFTKRCISDI